MSFKIVTMVLASAVADDGAITVAYPSGTNQAFFTGANASGNGALIVNNNEVYTEGDPGVEITYGGSDITVTNRSGESIPAGAELLIQLGYAGNDRPGFQPGDAIAALTDNSGGTASTTLAAIGGSYSQAEVRNSIASLNAQIERLRIALKTNGITS